MIHAADTNHGTGVESAAAPSALEKVVVALVACSTVVLPIVFTEFFPLTSTPMFARPL